MIGRCGRRACGEPRRKCGPRSSSRATCLPWKLSKCCSGRRMRPRTIRRSARKWERCCSRSGRWTRPSSNSPRRWPSIRTTPSTTTIAAWRSGCRGWRSALARISSAPWRSIPTSPRRGRTSRGSPRRSDLQIGGRVLPVGELVRLELCRERRRQVFGFGRPEAGREGERGQGFSPGFLPTAQDGDIAGEAGDIGVGVIRDDELDERLILVLGVFRKAQSRDFDVLLVRIGLGAGRGHWYFHAGGRRRLAGAAGPTQGPYQPIDAEDESKERQRKEDGEQPCRQRRTSRAGTSRGLPRGLRHTPGGGGGV